MENTPINETNDISKTTQQNAPDTGNLNDHNPQKKAPERPSAMELIEQFIMESLEEQDHQTTRHRGLTQQKPAHKPTPPLASVSAAPSLPGNHFTATEIRFFAQGEDMTRKNLLETKEIEDFIAQCPEWFPLQRPQTVDSITTTQKTAITKALESATPATQTATVRKPRPTPPFTPMETAFFQAGEEISRQNQEAQKAIEEEIATYPEMYYHLLDR